MDIMKYSSYVLSTEVVVSFARIEIIHCSALAGFGTKPPVCYFGVEAI